MKQQLVGQNIMKNKCRKHPKYKAMRKPQCDCKKCWQIWEDQVKRAAKVVRENKIT